MKKLLFIVTLALSFVVPTHSFAQSADVDTSGLASCANITMNLRYGSRDSSTDGAVSILQDFLGTHKYLDSEPTGFFGSLTRSAVAAFQTDNGISATPPGFVGSLTRAKIQAVDCNGATASSTVAVSTSSQTSVPSITIVSPTAGMVFKTGDRLSVNWIPQNISTGHAADVYLYSPVLGNISAYTFHTPLGTVSGSFSFTVGSDIAPGTYAMNVCDEATANPAAPSKPLCKLSGSFTVTSGAATTPANPIALTSPIGGESYTLGNPVTVTWTGSTFSVFHISLLYSDGTSNGAGSVGAIANVPGNTNSFVWDGQTVCQSISGDIKTGCTAVPVGNYKMYIVGDVASSTGLAVSVISPNSFALTAPSANPITITSPRGGEVIPIAATPDQSFPVKFNVANTYSLPATALLTVSLDGGETPGLIDHASTSTLNNILQTGQLLESFQSLEGNPRQAVEPGTYKLHLKLYSDLAQTHLVSDAVSNSFTLVPSNTSNTQFMAISPVPVATTTVAKGQNNVDLVNIIATINTGVTTITGLTVTNVSPNSQTNLSNIGLYQGGISFGAPASTLQLNNQIFTNATQYQFNFPSPVTIVSGKNTLFTVRGGFGLNATGTVQMSINGVSYPSGAPATISGVGTLAQVIHIQ